MISLHPYVLRAGKRGLEQGDAGVVRSGVWKQISAVRDGRRSKPIWVTEIGWPVDYVPNAKNEKKKFPPVSEKTQAKLTRAAFVMLHNRRHQLKVESAFYYNIADPPGKKGWVYSSGLLKTKNLQPREAYEAFEKLTHE